jgi:hypothetical protein
MPVFVGDGVAKELALDLWTEHDDEGIERCGVAAHGAIEERTV